AGRLPEAGGWTVPVLCLRRVRPAHRFFFHKQWGGRTPKERGRVLDGMVWDEMPQKSTA
ncbi:hypothetical protein RBA20_25080, partial [Mycobacteroides abscessus subsp. abscessus]